MTSEDGAIEGLTALRHVDPIAVDLTNAVIALLHGQRLNSTGDDPEAALKVAAVSAQNQASSYWFSTSSGCAFRIMTANSNKVALEPSRIGSCVDALNAVDPLLDLIEELLGISMEPTGFEKLDPALTLHFNIEARVDADVQSHIILAAQASHFDPAVIQANSEQCISDLSSMPCPFRVIIRSTGLSVEDAAGIDRGDLLLIEKRAMADVIWPVASASMVADEVQSGWLNMETGHFGCAVTGEDEMNDAPKFGGFTVPVTIALPVRTTSLDSLSSLQPGASLPLGAITEGLIVEVSVGGRDIARGEIVQIGDRFAVHIEERIDMDDIIHSDDMAEVI